MHWRTIPKLEELRDIKGTLKNSKKNRKYLGQKEKKRQLNIKMNIRQR